MTAVIALSAILAVPNPHIGLDDAIAWTYATRYNAAAQSSLRTSSHNTSATQTRMSNITPRSISASLAAIRQCESGGNYQAVSPDGRYRGAYQFDIETWAAVGGSGDPAAAPSSEQDARAADLQAQRGNQPWPVCGRQENR